MSHSSSRSPQKPRVLIISPALAKANNGNWQTARRWAGFLRHPYTVQCAVDWAVGIGAPPALMIALHARRSAAAVTAFAERLPGRPIVVVLTGTDLYRDIALDPGAQHSLRLAHRLVVLQSAALEALPKQFHEKTLVIYQSAVSLKPAAKASAGRTFRAIMIGHLREEKQPTTFMHAAALVANPAVKLDHIGTALDPDLGTLAVHTQAAVARYRWLGGLPHAQTRQRLKRSALMVITSRIEGGANVITEALTCGVPVLASDISGNRGMLGPDYAGYFPVGDAAALARLIDRAAAVPEYLALLRSQCAARSALFAPGHEQAAVLALADNCIGACAGALNVTAPPISLPHEF